MIYARGENRALFALFTFLFIFIVFTGFLIQSCNNEGNTVIITPDVYVAGYTTNSSGVTVPCYWKKGVRTDLTDVLDSSKDGQAVSISISGTYQISVFSSETGSTEILFGEIVKAFSRLKLPCTTSVTTISVAALQIMTPAMSIKICLNPWGVGES